jgi:hypothetical protein
VGGGGGWGVPSRLQTRLVKRFLLGAGGYVYRYRSRLCASDFGCVGCRRQRQVPHRHPAAPQSRSHQQQHTNSQIKLLCLFLAGLPPYALFFREDVIVNEELSE